MTSLHRRICRFIIVALAMVGAAGFSPAPGQSERSSDRSRLAHDILRRAQGDYPGLEKELVFKAVLKAIASIDRANFVPDDQRTNANKDAPLPIGFDQTISEPYIVAIMTSAVGARAGSNVLEIGTGSGYQAAVLSRLGASVHTIEIIPQLAQAASERLRRLEFKGVTIKAGDGFVGWPEFAPYDAIIVTAGSSDVPPPLLAQMKTGGRLVMPIGANTPVEQLIVFTKRIDGGFNRCSLGPAMFVPFTGAGQKPENPAAYDRGVPLCRRGQTARWPGQAVG
jgi:protein-L-isoaspartate(D-aspartate) O-methyltransferase